MAYTYTQLQSEVLVRLGADTTSSFYTESDIRDWLNRSYIWSSAYHKWPQTEYKDKSSAFTKGTETYSYPNATFKTDSIRILQIGSYLFKKKNFADYLKWREDYPDRDDKYFSDYGRSLYINPNCASGTIYAYGQYTPTGLAMGSSSTVFANNEDEADEAIIEKTLSYAFLKEKKFKESISYESSAKQKLDELWKRITDEQYAYQNINQSMFSDIDVVKGETPYDMNNPLQF